MATTELAGTAAAPLCMPMGSAQSFLVQARLDHTVVLGVRHYGLFPPMSGLYQMGPLH
jgi:hypothetical protein